MNYPTEQEIQELIAREAKQMHAEVNAKAKADGHTEVSRNWLKYLACKTSLKVLIPIIKAGGEKAIEEIASRLGLSADTVNAILDEAGKDAEKAIPELCEAMGMCP